MLEYFYRVLRRRFLFFVFYHSVPFLLSLPSPAIAGIVDPLRFAPRIPSHLQSVMTPEAFILHVAELAGSEHPVCWAFPGLKKSVQPKMGVSSRLPARQIRMQELELLYPQHPSKRDAFTRAFHQKEAFLQSAPLPLFCGSRRNKNWVVSGLLY
ncbi:hypothetical protein RIF29_46988 [Crotalaria pallida]|uniref:Uncharacterized protein n=1 Tax=Crotalaria pallida TaxID=3830 RepID=A0AAN9DSB9_CROPI